MWSAWVVAAAIGAARATWIKPCETWTLVGVDARAKTSVWDTCREVGEDGNPDCPTEKYLALNVTPCTMLRFTYGSNFDVWRMPNKAAYDECDFSDAKEVGNGLAGGGQAGSGRITQVTDEPAFQFEITQAHLGSTLYFADRKPCGDAFILDSGDCQDEGYGDQVAPYYLAQYGRKLYTHCEAGQKVRVNVESSENIPLDQVSIASTAANIDVFWGVYGYAMTSVGLVEFLPTFS